MRSVRQDGSGQFRQHLARPDHRPGFPENPADPSRKSQKALIPLPNRRASLARDRVRMASRRIRMASWFEHSPSRPSRLASRRTRLTCGRDPLASRHARVDDGLAFFSDETPADRKIVVCLARDRVCKPSGRVCKPSMPRLADRLIGCFVVAPGRGTSACRRLADG